MNELEPDLPFLVDLPEPDWIWSGPDYMVVIYEDWTTFLSIEMEEKFFDFQYLTGGKFVYDGKNQFYIRSAAQTSLWEGLCYIFVCHGMGEGDLIHMEEDTYQYVSDLEKAVNRGHFPSKVG